LSNIILKADNIQKSFGTLNVLKGVNLDVCKGEILTIIGKSGSGKSTLLHICGTLDRPDSGTLFIDNKDLYKIPESEIAYFRNRHIGFVFQFHHLLNEFTALENILIPSMIAKTNQKEAKSRAIELMEILQIDERMDHKPNQLSGGEQQRVAIARALINRPDLIMADEPTGNLDSQSSSELHNLIFSLRDQFSLTFIIVTHNADLAQMSDRSLTMKDGLLM
jgi:lipoprotein-releasing system ATP-binding protein